MVYIDSFSILHRSCTLFPAPVAPLPPNPEAIARLRLQLRPSSTPTPISMFRLVRSIDYVPSFAMRSCLYDIVRLTSPLLSSLLSPIRILTPNMGCRQGNLDKSQLLSSLSLPSLLVLLLTSFLHRTPVCPFLLA